MAIIAADNASESVLAPLAELKQYAAAHMGAGVNLVLSGSYGRAQAAAKAAAQTASDASAAVYADAQRACSGKTDSLTQARCNQAYLAAHLPSVPAAASVQAPAVASFTYHFAAPLWTADLAGALLAGGIAAGVMALIGLRRRRL